MHEEEHLIYLIKDYLIKNHEAIDTNRNSSLNILQTLNDIGEKTSSVGLRWAIISKFQSPERGWPKL